MLWLPLLLAALYIACVGLALRRMPKPWKGYPRVTHAAQRFYWESKMSRRGLPTESRIGLEARLPEFIVEDARPAHRFSAAFGLAHFLPGKPRLAVCCGRRMARHIKRQPQILPAIRAAFAAGADRVESGPRRLSMRLRKPCEPPRQKTVDALMESLNILHEALEGSTVKPGGNSRVRLAAFWAIPGYLLTAGLILYLGGTMLRFEVIDWQPLWAWLAVTVLTAQILFIFCVRLLLARSRYAHTVLIAGLRRGLPCGALAGIAILYFINCLFDPGPPQPHDMNLSRKTVLHGKRSTTYTLKVDDWRQAGHSLVVSVGPLLYDSVREGEPVRVTGRPGLLGMEWIADVEKINE